MKIRISGEEHNCECSIDGSINLLHLLQKKSIRISAPCGGKGTCGKCKVDIEGVGSVLSCQTELNETYLREHGLELDLPVEVRLPKVRKARISTEGFLPDFECAPLLVRGHYDPEPATIRDQRPDDRRFEEITGLRLPFDRTASLSDRLQNPSRPIHFLFRRDTKQVVKFLPDGETPLFGMAVDIGTTTLAAYLYDLDNGLRLAAVSRMNPQRSYGADVISRIEQVDRDPAKLFEMQVTILKAVDEMSRELLDIANAAGQEIQTLVFSGNTTMMHLLSGLNPSAIARSPFIPVSLSGQVLSAAQCGLHMAGDPLFIMLPSISAYVGADITAGILACEMYTEETGFDADAAAASKNQKRLLLDIGTNGEMVLSGPAGLIACSTAAGPAFEAANIQCGMGGTDGAVDQINVEDGCLTCSIIGGADHAAIGLCGSGLVSAIAAMLRFGVIDDTGRFTDEPDELPSDLQERLAEQGDQIVFYLDRPNGDVYLTQKDIRELQNAKAAMAAGIQRLLSQAGMKAEDLDEILIAGGFGNYLRASDAFAIGLLPPGLEKKTRAVGNTSGMGAIACLINDSLRQTAARVAAAVHYYELSADPAFTDLYIDAMTFPEQEFE